MTDTDDVATDLPDPVSIVIVDLETSALRPSMRGDGPVYRGSVPHGQPRLGVAVECAWWNLDTGENGSFVPRHNVQAVRAYGEPQALAVCHYLERLAEADQDDGTEVLRLHAQLTGNTLAGVNPAFDVRFLDPLFGRTPTTRTLVPDPWRYRLLDISALAVGVLDLDPHRPPGAAKIAELLEVPAPDHTAAGDVRSAGECLQRLMAIKHAHAVAHAGRTGVTR